MIGDRAFALRRWAAYRLLAAGFVLANLALWQFTQRQAALYEEAQCHFAHPIPGLAPDRITAIAFGLLILSVLLTNNFGLLFIIAPFCLFTISCLDGFNPEAIFRGCYGGQGENEDVTGLGNAVAIFVLVIVWAYFVVLASGAFRIGSAWMTEINRRRLGRC